MSLYKLFRTKKDFELLAEEKLFANVAEEIAAGNILQGLWTKATSETESNLDADIEKKYIKLRVAYLLAERRLDNQFLEEALVATKNVKSGYKPAAAVNSNSDYSIVCPFCSSNLSSFGVCGWCGKTVDQSVINAHTQK